MESSLVPAVDPFTDRACELPKGLADRLEGHNNHADLALMLEGGSVLLSGASLLGIAVEAFAGEKEVVLWVALVSGLVVASLSALALLPVNYHAQMKLWECQKEVRAYLSDDLDTPLDDRGSEEIELEEIEAKES